MKETVTVHVQLFSGRPNPTFEVDDTLILRFLNRAGYHPVNDFVSTSEVFPLRMGYTGFMFRWTAATHIVHDELLYVQVAEDRWFSYDDMGLESALIELSKREPFWPTLDTALSCAV